MPGRSPSIPRSGLPSRPTCQQVALVSSHLGRWPHRRRDWFAALATVCRKLLRPGSTLIHVHGTTTAPYLQRCGSLFGHSVVSKDTTNVTRSDRDRLAVRNADLVVVLATRNGSRTRSLVDNLLDPSQTHRPELWFSSTRSLVADEIAATWKHLGARPFDPQPTGSVTPPATTATNRLRLASQHEIHAVDWLVHCTRECSGPWPGQDHNDYLDDLILDRPSGDHSVQNTLRRILSERRLRAVSRPVRGAAAAVSFTACPLQQLASRRTFRAHRGRWDFEPYGLAISRDWLLAQGARPVVYRDHSDLMGNDPFEQPARSQGSGRYDWRTEQEWRHPGDIDLGSLPADSALVLVHSDDDIDALDGHGPWPVAAISRFDKTQPAIQ